MISTKAKVIGGIVIALLIGIAVFILVKKLKRSSIENIKVDTGKTTITDTQATLIVQSMLSAMDRYGTDEQAIVDALTGLNENDLLLVIRKFGTKPYNGQALATDWVSKSFFSSEKDLAGWLRAELSGNSLETVKQIFLTNNVPF